MNLPAVNEFKDPNREYPYTTLSTIQN